MIAKFSRNIPSEPKTFQNESFSRGHFVASSVCQAQEKRGNSVFNEGKNGMDG